MSDENDQKPADEFDVPRLYRFAMGLTIAMCLAFAAGLVAHFTLGMFSSRGALVMTVGIGFWLLMFFGYRSDLKESSFRARRNVPRRRSTPNDPEHSE